MKNESPATFSINRKVHDREFRTVDNKDIIEMARQSKKPIVQFIFMLSWHPSEVISTERLIERNIEIGSKLSERQAYKIFQWLEASGRLRRIRERRKGKLMKATYELWEEPYGWREIDCTKMQVDESPQTAEKSNPDKDLATCTKMQEATLNKERANHSRQKAKRASLPAALPKKDYPDDMLKALAGSGIYPSQVDSARQQFDDEYITAAATIAAAGDSPRGYFNFLTSERRDSVTAALEKRRAAEASRAAQKRALRENLNAQAAYQAEHTRMNASVDERAESYNDIELTEQEKAEIIEQYARTKKPQFVKKWRAKTWDELIRIFTFQEFLNDRTAHSGADPAGQYQGETHHQG